MRNLAPQLQLQRIWRYFLNWFWAVSLMAALTGDIKAGIFIATITIFFFRKDWRNTPYESFVIDGAGPRARWRSALVLIALCVAIGVLAQLVFLFWSHRFTIAAPWLIVFALTTFALCFTKPLARPANKAL
jgi:hypothetical protein